MSVAEVFRKITIHLEQSGISYMLVGSFASSFHDALRSARDEDFVIEAAPPQLQMLITGLQAHNYWVELDAALDAFKHESLFNLIDNTSGWKIGLIFCKSPSFDREEFRRRVEVRLFDIHLPIASAEDVIVSKLERAKPGGSQRQIEEAKSFGCPVGQA